MKHGGLRSNVLAACVILCSPALYAATYYVATTGSDSNPGTSTAPFATLQKGVDAAGPGDTIIVGDGTYGPTGGLMSFGVTINKAGTASAPITLEAAHTWGAVLDCKLTCHSYIDFGASSAYWVVKGFDIVNGYWSGFFSNSGGGSNVLIQGNHIHNIGNQPNTTSNGVTGIYFGSGGGSVRIDGNLIHDIGRTTNITGNHDHGIYIHSPGSLITNNVLYRMLNGYDIQTAAGFSGTIANNTFYGPNAVSTKPGQLTLWGADSNVSVRNNIFYNPTISGLHNSSVSMSGTCSIDHNIVYSSAGTMALIDSLPSGCTQTANQLNVDPRLVAPASFNFNLQAGSPAIGAGAAVPGVTTDFNGTTRTSWDIGAFAAAGGAATTPPTPPQPPPTTPPPAAGCTTVSTSWGNAAFTSQTGSFTLAFDATPAMAAMDGVIGASNGAATSYASLAAIVRFNNTGHIDARNGASYAAAASIPYTAGTSYHFRLVVNLQAHTYSAYVTPAGGAETLIGSNYAFRVEQAGVTALGNLGGLVSTGGAQFCSVAASGATATPPPPVAGPVISGVTASNITSSGATIGWTTSTPATSAVDYGPTSSYGSTAPNAAVVAQTTSHSVPLSGLSASTLYHYRVRSIDSSGAQAVSGDNSVTTSAAAVSTPPPAPTGCVSAPAGSWKNEAMSPLTGTFTVQFSATPGMAREDAVMGLSNGPASAYASLAAAVRFNNTGTIDARNAGAYTASASIPYASGQLYQFRLVVNAAARTYSAYVTPPGGAEKTIGLNYKFRTEQASASTLNHLAIFDSTGGQTICNLSANGVPYTLQ